MAHRCTSLILAFVLLACPFGCLAGASCCASSGVADGRSCCGRCESDAASSETSDEVPANDCCTACCLCKGAVLGEALPDLTPSFASLLTAPSPVAVAMNVPASTCNVPPTSFSDLYGDALRIAIGSFLC